MKTILDELSKRLFLIVVICMTFISLQVSAAVSPMEMVMNAKPWVVLVIMIWEYLVGKTKLVKANSTIELIENFAKQILGIKQEDLRAY